MNLQTKPHPHPYRIGWITNAVDVIVIDCCLVKFSIDTKYFDEILCNVVVLLGRQWQCDLNANHKGHDNIYVFLKDGHKFVLNLLHEKEAPLGKQNSSVLLMDQKDLLNDLKYMELTVFVIQNTYHLSLPSETVPTPITKLLAKFLYISGTPTTPPPLRDIQHQIDLIPRCSLPNLLHY